MATEPDLFTPPRTTTLPYGGHSGHVANSETSTERAFAEDGSGETSKRLSDILRLMRAHPAGLTWMELGAQLDLHHGQISGALSTLHRLGEVFMLKAKRDRCHPYVHAVHRRNYPPDMRLDVPAKTRVTEEREAREVLLIAVDAVLSSQSWDTIQALREARKHYRIATSGDPTT